MRATILNASAGSGKTYQLAYRYVSEVIAQPARYRTILAVTFTNKATEEMKSRILREIHALASGARSPYLERLCRELALDAPSVRLRAREVRSKILHDYSRFTVLTIDTFFQRILRAFIKELGIELDYNVEIETESVLARSADLLVDEITDDAELQRWLLEFVGERIEEGRKWDVREGILSLGGELFKEKNKAALSGARSKQELGRRIGRVLGRAKASRERLQQLAQQAVDRMAAAGVGPGDFRGKSRSFVNCFFQIAAGTIKPFTDTARAMSGTAEGWCPAGSPAAPLVCELQPLLRQMCTVYDRNVRFWNTAELVRENYRSFALLADLYARVQQMCDRQNIMLLSETKYILSEFIDRNDAPFIYEKVGNRYERFMIDEFQDTSAREWENFLPLLRNAMAQSERPSVLLVGDIKQSIYRWRGGDWRILHREAQQALGGPGEAPVIPLRENWRSLPAVVDFNNRIIGRVVATDNARLDGALAQAVAGGALPEAVAAELRGMLPAAYADHEQRACKKGMHPGYVRIDTCTGPPPVVERIRELIDRGFRPKDILILVRSATDGARIASMLLDFKRTNDDPRYRFDVMTQEALIVGKAPVASFVTAAMQLAVNPEETLARALYNRYLGRAFDAPLRAEERSFFRALRMLSPEEAFERIVMHARLQDDRRQTAYLQALHEQVIAFCANRVADLPLFLAWWKETGRNRSLSVERSETTVEIMTVHKAKGLEKRVVIIPYCTWQLDPRSGGMIDNIVWAEAADDSLEGIGRFPVRYKRSMADSDFSAEYYRELVYTHVDNINLLYVALTRAKESLHIFVSDTGTRNPTVGSLMVGAIATDDGRALLGGSAGTQPVAGAPGTHPDTPAERHPDTDGTQPNAAAGIRPEGDRTHSDTPAEGHSDTDDTQPDTAAGMQPKGDSAHTDTPAEGYPDTDGTQPDTAAGMQPEGDSGHTDTDGTQPDTAAGIRPEGDSAHTDTDGTQPDAVAGIRPEGNVPVGDGPDPILVGRHTVTEAGERFEFGTFTGPDPVAEEERAAEHVVLETYPTAEADLRLRLPSQRYFEAGDASDRTPRNLGILMHRAFEHARTAEEIHRAVAEMQTDGVLSAGEAATLRGMIDRALADPLVREWFDGSWTEVRNEEEIIVPGSASTRRPDRVMVRGTEATVVDYKFGGREPGRHERQVGEYLALLRGMGYRRVRGYIWYVRLGEVAEVESEN